jgi:hypothetical protein
MVIAADYPLLEIIWTMFVFFGFVLWFSLLFKVIGDLFRRDDIGGGGKFAGSMLVIFLPLFGAFAYLISQGEAMQLRDIESRMAQQEAFDNYIRETVARGETPKGASPATP